MQPDIRDRHNFVRIGIEPGSPPTEGAVGDDIVLADAHQIHVEITARALVVVNIGNVA